MLITAGWLDVFLITVCCGWFGRTESYYCLFFVYSEFVWCPLDVAVVRNVGNEVDTRQYNVCRR